MGVRGIVDQIELIFARKENFDESGFAYADLVTPDLAGALCSLGEKDERKLERLGYGFNWFDETRTDGIIYRSYRERAGKVWYVRRLYFNRRKDEKTDG